MYAGNRVCGFRAGHWPYYPCQTCLPQEHCTVSVGAFFVSCCLQTGHGLVITYVISLRLLLKSGHPVTCTSPTTDKFFCSTSCSRLANAEALPAQRLGTASAGNLSAHDHNWLIELPWENAIHEPFRSRVARNQSVWQRRLFTQRSSFRHGGTAIAVARIFPTASRKFPSFSISGCLPSEKLPQPDRMTRAMGGPHRVYPQLPRVWFCHSQSATCFHFVRQSPSSAKSTNLWHL